MEISSKCECSCKDKVLLNEMHKIQDKEGYLSDESVRKLSNDFLMTEAQVLSAVTFYGMIHRKEQASTNIQICRSAPCHVAGAQEVINLLEKTLGIKVGQTTKDGKYSLEYVECLGQCQSSPSMMINEKLYMDVKPEQISTLLKESSK